MLEVDVQPVGAALVVLVGADGLGRGGAGVAQDQLGAVLEFVLGVRGLGPGLPAVRAGVRLDLGEGERPCPVLLGPRRFTRGDDTAEEDGARDTPRAGGLYFSPPPAAARRAEAANEKGTRPALLWTSQAASNRSLI